MFHCWKQEKKLFQGMNLWDVNYLWQKSEKTLHKNLYHVWKKVKAVKINVYFSGEKMLSCEKLNMKKNQEKTFWIMIELTEKNIFRKKSWRNQVEKKDIKEETVSIMCEKSEKM